MADNPFTSSRSVTPQPGPFAPRQTPSNPIAQGALNVPDTALGDSLTTSFPQSVASEDDYGPTITGAGARKLAASQVAPLVAATRGYRTMHASRESVAESCAYTGLDGSSRFGKLLSQLAQRTDALLIPFYSLATVNGNGSRQPDTWQVRPSVAEDDKKYLFAGGVSVVVDCHPATPISYFSGRCPILLTEGPIKADSGLTALLQHVGKTPEMLGEIDGTSQDIFQRLHDMLESIPEADRVLIIDVGGVGTWHQNSEWNTLPMGEREVLVAFDGDVYSNPLVWNQAKQMFDFVQRRRGTPRLIDLFNPETQEKIGLDDYFATRASWKSLIGLKKGSLPPRPETELDAVLPFTMSDDGTEFLQKTTDAEGKTRLTPVHRIGGRVKAIELTRGPTQEEIETGRIMPTGEAVSNENVVFEVSWRNPITDAITRREITANMRSLDLSPKEWGGRQVPASIPPEVRLHPEWPPAKGSQWLGALKTHRSDERETRVRWNGMGWMPTEDGRPVFVIGSQVIGPHGDGDPRALPGVTENVLPGSSQYGVILDPTMPLQDRRQLLNDVVMAYTGNGAFRDPAIGIILMCAGLRPLSPIPSNLVLYFSGPPQGGKSLAASNCISFLQARPGAFNEDKLGGSAKDTAVATELGIAQTPLFIKDDLAPAMSRAKYDREADMVADTVRSVFGRQPKRRSSVDLTSRALNVPRAVFIVTAENPHGISSVVDRTVPITFSSSRSKADATSMQPIMTMRDKTGAQSRLAGLIVMNIHERMERLGERDTQGIESGMGHVRKSAWEREIYPRLHMDFEETRAEARDFIMERNGTSSGEARHAVHAANLKQSLVLLEWLAEDLGMPASFMEHLASLTPALYGYLAKAHAAMQQRTPGANLMRAISELLQNGTKVHVVNPDYPGELPYRGDDPKSPATQIVNSAMGWSSDAKPMGARVGYYVSKGLSGFSEDILLLSESAIFDQAQALLPKYLPSGATAETAWSSAANEGLTVKPSEIGRFSQPKGASSHSIRLRRKRTTGNGECDITGVPVLLSRVIGDGAPCGDDLDLAQLVGNPL